MDKLTTCCSLKKVPQVFLEEVPWGALFAFPHDDCIRTWMLQEDGCFYETIEEDIIKFKDGTKWLDIPRYELMSDASTDVWYNYLLSATTMVDFDVVHLIHRDFEIGCVGTKAR